jgi:hypothetical protein
VNGRISFPKVEVSFLTNTIFRLIRFDRHHLVTPQNLLPCKSLLNETIQLESQRGRFLIRYSQSVALKSLLLSLLMLLTSAPTLQADPPEWSVARQWNEQLLHAIRNDFARPTVHARNLYHVSAAMWDAWAAYDSKAEQLIHQEKLQTVNTADAREEAISYAVYRLMTWRFSSSPGGAESLPSFDAKMDELGYDRSFTSTTGNSPAALGNRIAETYINYGLGDNSNEVGEYENMFYEPVNDPLAPAGSGNPDITDSNRWQPLALDVFIDQGGNIHIFGFPDFLSPEWGTVTPFALSSTDLTVYERNGDEYWVYHDPGPPPQLGGAGDAEYKQGFEQVVLWSGLLDPADGVMIDISPASNGNNTLGTNDGPGYTENPVTGMPYTPEVVPAGDYYRVLAEFWADGPESETPPGHWFTIANYVSDHPLVEKKIAGKGPVLDALEWDVKMYLAMGGTMHDAAVTAWGIKGWYDYIRPISAIRLMCDNGQSSEAGPSYHPEGIGLYPDSIEIITAESVAAGARHYGLGGNMGQHIGKIAVNAWRGPDYILNEETDTAGVGWIRCEDWWPYQRPSFVTPPFAGYVSGHSVYSRAAAVLMTRITGDEFFPGGLGTFEAPQDEFLVFEDGPSVDITLQWAKYYDAADETSLSRIYGGIHPPADDIPGRIMGAQIGEDSWVKVLQVFGNNTTSRATFKVTKDFTDGNNPSEVDVTLDCYTGLPITQTQTISESRDVEFIVKDFTDKKLDCTITENPDSEGLGGYTPEYTAEGPGLHDNLGACNYFEIEDQGAYTCQVENHADPVTVFFSKQWIVDGKGGDYLDQNFRLTLYCDSRIVEGRKHCQSGFGSRDIGNDFSEYDTCAVFAGTGDAVFSVSVIPAYPNSSCWVKESIFDDTIGVENGCGNIVISAGTGASCVVTNTVFFEGIPTLNQYSLAILALLMLAMGLVGFRPLYPDTPP